MVNAHSRLFRPAVLVAVFTGLMGGCAHGPSAAISSSVVVWRIENPSSVGGQKPEVLGSPQVEDSPGGKALVFNGASDGLIVRVNPIAGWKQFTIEVLFDPAVDGAEAQRFFHIQDTAGRRALLEIRLTPDHQWSLDTYLLDGASNRALNDPAQLHPSGRWTWVALRYDGSTLASFVNGVPQMEGSVIFSPMGEGQTSVGVRLNKVYWYKGGIREVRFTPRAVATSELQKMAPN